MTEWEGVAVKLGDESALLVENGSGGGPVPLYERVGLEDDALRKLIADSVGNRVLVFAEEQEVIEDGEVEFRVIQDQEILAAGGNNAPHLRVVDMELTAEQLGVPTQIAGEATHPFQFLQRFAVDARGCFAHLDGNLIMLRSCEQIVATSVKELERHAGEQLRDEIDRRAASLTRFVNPYNFVPLPTGTCTRGAPQGHGRLAPDNLSGTITVSLTAQSPIMARGAVGADNSAVALRRTIDGEAYPYVQGSSIKGMVRSLHETIAGGCMRVLDEDFVPVYRDVARVRPANQRWSIAVVEEVDSEGRPTRLQLCDETIWIEADVLKDRLGPLATGMTCDIDVKDVATDRRIEPLLGRLEFVDNAAARQAVRSGAEWTVLLTDASARNPKYPYHAAVARLTNERGRLTVPAFDVYGRTVARSNPVRTGESGPREIMFGGEFIGTRQPIRDSFEGAEVVWVRRSSKGPGDDGIVDLDELTRSYLWRSEGEGRLIDRVPESFRPCQQCGAVESHEDLKLCPSCAIFGAADDQEDEERQAAAYRSHIRFSECVSIEPVPVGEQVALPGQGAPNPGSGQFYLNLDGVRMPRKGGDPKNRWVRGDAPSPIRGRKYYWPAFQRDNKKYQRHLPPRNQPAGVSHAAELLPDGTRFRYTLTFENLTRSQLGGLLVACDPNLALDAHRPSKTRTGAGQRLVVRLGGGKPLGLGIVDARIETLQAHGPLDRYGSTADDGPAGGPKIDGLVQAFTDSIDDSVKKDSWRALAAMLDPGFVAADRVAYAPKSSTDWNEINDPAKGWSWGEKWFAETSGAFGKEFLPLSDATDPLGQYLPIDPNNVDDAE